MTNSTLRSLLLCAVLGVHSCTPNKPASGKNLLLESSSPYLLQHAHDPVWWNPWGKPAFESALAQQKPVFLSIGYSSCHWCHVMGHESFNDPEVAKILNRSFVSIKVDREEHPEVDAAYLEAVKGMTGSAGWPMTVFASADQVPFFGGTYFSKQDLIRLLLKVEERWKADQKALRSEGLNLARWLKEQQAITSGKGITQDALIAFSSRFGDAFDSRHGGIGDGPKFPPVHMLRLLLRIHRRTGSSQALSWVTRTLDAMASGGIQDSLGGGFHRYSVDDGWRVPHFEKTLYDQAQMARIYLEAYQVTGRTDYRKIARRTLDYALIYLRSAKGEFYSAQDADSEGHEGRFYTWTVSEIKKSLDPAEFNAFERVFPLTEQGNAGSGQNALHVADLSKALRPGPLLASALQKLSSIRERRVAPATDKKILSGWNGLMISALARAGSVLGDQRYIDAAILAAERVLLINTQPPAGLMRRSVNEHAEHLAVLEDFALLIEATLELYQATGRPEWLTRSMDLQSKQDHLMGDVKTGGYFSAPAASQSFLGRRKVYRDEQIAAGNSVTALNLLRLHAFTFDDQYLKRARSLFDSSPDAAAQPLTYPALLLAADYWLDDSKEVAVVADKDGPELRAMTSALLKPFLPNLVLAHAISDSHSSTGLLVGKKALQGKPTAYVCSGKTCKLPTTDPSLAVKLAGECRKYELKDTRP